MTAVEFFDRRPVENVISSLTTAPDKIIFIGGGKVMRRFDRVYREFLQRRNIQIEIAYRSIKRNDLNSIVQVLCQIVEEEEACVFDLTGGEDLALVAMGIVYEKYRQIKPVQMQWFNINNTVVSDCDADGVVHYSGVPVLSVEDNIRLHGGIIRYDTSARESTYRWDISEEFLADIAIMWDICKVNPGLWNTQLGVPDVCNALGTEEDSLDVRVDLCDLHEWMKRSGRKQVPIGSLMRKLEDHHLVYYYRDDGETLSFRYKNAQIKKCLSKAGTVLEMQVLATALTLAREDGEPFYSDAMNGVYIDWDGELHDLTEAEKDTENEIDVILMNGMVPIFISCKNGHVDDDELYKLNVVTERFGGAYAKKVLIASYLGKGASSMEYFKQRAKDMNITLIDGVHKLTDTQFRHMVKHLGNH